MKQSYSASVPKIHYNYYLLCRIKLNFFPSELPLFSCKASLYMAPPHVSPVYSCCGVNTAPTAHVAVTPAADSLSLEPLHSIYLRPMVTPVQVRDRSAIQSFCPLARPLAVNQY